MLEQVTDPVEFFAHWFGEASAAEDNDPNAMTLATVDAAGLPHARIVLLKGFDHRGFSFFTNLESGKATDLKEKPVAALCFHWKSLRRQVRIEGRVEHVDADESDRYFATRARDSQIGAWASSQSQPLESRAVLEARVAEITARFAGAEVPRPARWGGLRLVPRYFEFWQDRPHRLHDRIVFEAAGAIWQRGRLYP